jgi:hypothetical protein
MIHILFDRSKYLSRRADGKQLLRAELIADTAAELEGITEVGENVLVFGSTALTADGKALMLASDSTWHDLSDGSEV